MFLHWLIGLRRLDVDVLFVDWLDSAELDGDAGRSEEARYFARLMREHSLDDASVLLDRATGAALVGRSRGSTAEWIRNSSLLLNFMGYLRDDDLLAAAPQRVFVDIDPGFPQMWRELGLHDAFADHDAFVTVGANVGTSTSTIPTAGLDWLITRPPVVLEWWPVEPPSRPTTLTSVGAWRGPYGPVTYDGRTYGLRVHELRRFAQLPLRVSGDFELALDIDAADAADVELLDAGGWRLVDPEEVAATPSAFRSYIQGSAGEIGIAKGMYVTSRSGWFSDRSACYLASGRPAVVQDTGLGAHYPTGEGLLTFETLDEAAEAVEAVFSAYDRHARAARDIAVDLLDSDRVIADLLASLGVR